MMSGKGALQQITDWSSVKRKFMISALGENADQNEEKKFWNMAAKEVCEGKQTAVFRLSLVEDFLNRHTGGIILCLTSIIEDSAGYN